MRAAGHSFDVTVEKRGLKTANLLIRGAKQLLTLRGSRTPRRGAALNDIAVIPGGEALISGEALVEVSSAQRVENVTGARDAEEINATGRVVMPGFIDCHTHLAFPPPNADEDDRVAAERALTTDTGKRTAARWLAYLRAMAAHGTSTVEIKTGAGLNEDAERKLLRVLSILGNEPLEIVPTFLLRLPRRGTSSDAAVEAYLEKVTGELFPRLRQKGLARFADVAWDAEPAHYPLFDRCLRAARRAGLPCKVHAEGNDSAPAAAMAVRNLAVSVDHLEQTTASDVSILAGTPTMATLLPMASFHGRLANAPARALIEAGVPIALGSNFNARHCPTLNMQTVVSMACLRSGLTPAEAISAATINAAHALGCAETKGSLEAGKQADVIILNAGDYRDLAGNVGANWVHCAIKRGEVIYREGRVSAPGTPPGERGPQARPRDTMMPDERGA